MPTRKKAAKRAKKVDPIDEALEAGEKLAARQEKDLHMWQQWKTDPSPQNTQAMLRRLEPVFKSFEQQHKAPRTNAPAMRLVMQEQALKALETYDPSKGAAPTTWVQSNIRRAQRFNIQQQNVARISEENVGHIGRINRANELLQNQFGRDPTHDELAQHLNVGMPKRRQLTAQKIQEIQLQASRRDLPSTGFESDPTPSAAQLDSEVISLLPDRFARAGKQDHMQVLDLIYNQGVHSTGAIAKQLGWSQSKVSRIKTDIENEYRSVRGQPVRGSVSRGT